MIRIYARVSTDDKGQTPENQLREIRRVLPALSAAVEYIEYVSAVKKRPVWERMLAESQAGDTILIWRLDRAFRSVADAVLALEAFRARGIHFKAVAEGWDTTTPAGILLYNVIAAMAQFEWAVLSERTRAGMARAKAAGKHVGRPRMIR